METQTIAASAAFAALGTTAGRQDPYPLYEAIREHGNLVRLKPGRMVAVGYAECDRALRAAELKVHDQGNYDILYPGWRSHSSLRGFTNSMLYRNAPDHDRMRAITSFAFTPRRVTELTQVIEGMTGRLLDRMSRIGADDAAVDVIGDFAARLPIAVIARILGFPEDDQVWFRQMAADVAVALDGLGDHARIEQADAAMDSLSEYFARMLGEQHRQPADNLVGRMVSACETGRGLSGPELAGNLMLLLTAGFETTSFLIGHGVMLAIEHPDFAERLRGEAGFAARFVEEILRFEPPVQVTSRWVGADVELTGTTVPAGTRIALILAAGNRDPRRFARPDRFDPDRPDNQPLSFGAGSHFCLGAPLARLEARIALAEVFRRFPRLSSAGRPSHRDRVVVRGLESLPVVIG